MEFTPQYWHWLVFGMILIMVEMALPSFTALWFGAGALLVGVLLLIFPALDLNWQVFIWTISSALTTFLWFRYLKPKSINRTMAGLSREAIVGEVGLVIAVPQEHRRGQLRFPVPILGSEEWDIICQQPLALGDRVVVADLSGNALIVTRHSAG
jgi:membrane protein implicated in regulation of membrane protease activity